MNEPPPGPSEASPSLRARRTSRRRVVFWSALGSLAVVVLGLAALFWFPRVHDSETGTGLPTGVPRTDDSWLNGKDFSASNSVSVLLGEKESGNGLTHIDGQRDGLTTIQSVNGVPCRYLSLTQNRTTLYFYFRIEPSFKQADVKTVAIEIEYLDPKPGVVGIHYDALDAPNNGNPVYREALRPVRMRGSNSWQTATFHTKNAGFGNLQNSGADFRIWAKAPELYVRRVTVTRETEQAAPSSPPAAGGLPRPEAGR